MGPVFKRLDKLVKEYDGNEHVTAGFYFDDPAKVSGDSCRASVGVIVEKGLGEAGKKCLKFVVGKLCEWSVSF